MPQCPRCGSRDCIPKPKHIPGEERLLGSGGGCIIRIYICLKCGNEFRF